MLTIAVDMDDTVLDFVPTWLDIYNKITGERILARDIKSWAISSYVKQGDLLLDLLNSESLYETVLPVRGAYEGIENLRSMGNKVVFASARFHHGKIESLKKHGFITSDDDWIIAHDKSLIKANYLVDDGIHNFQAFKNAGGLSVLFKRSWNQDRGIWPCFSTWTGITNYFSRGKANGEINNNIWKG